MSESKDLDVKGISLLFVCGDDQARVADLTNKQHGLLIKCVESMSAVDVHNASLVDKGSLLMTRDNPSGMKLEDLLANVSRELSDKNEYLQTTLEETVADCDKRGVLLEAIENNNNIIELLGEAYETQQNTTKAFERLGPDKGSKEPRI